MAALALAEARGLRTVGGWLPGEVPAEPTHLVRRVREPLHVVWDASSGRVVVGAGGEPVPGGGAPYALLGTLPPLYPEWLGDPGFRAAHGVRFAYVAGEMANGIATTEMVAAMARAGVLGFFGAAGLPLERLEGALDVLQRELADLPWGSNLIHSPQDPALEDAVVDLYLRHGVRRVSASAFMALRPSVVRYAFSGLRPDASGRPVRSHRLFAKISRPEVAAQFMSPPPAAMLEALVARGQLTAEEARLGATLPVAEDVTVEADSGGHTDNRPLTALLPTILGLRDRLRAPVRVGCAGGLGTPQSVAAAYAMGAAYVLTGSINQAAVESGLSAAGKRMLAAADLADVVMAPAADMFEMGVRVQVLKRGTLFAARASRLHDLYRRHPSLEAIPADVRRRLEDEVFRAPLQEIWEATARFFAARDPAQITRAEADPHHRMALVFRWYLGNASGWAIAGDPERAADYQIWCGPAMGAFNAWTAGSFLADPERRTVVQIALNLLEGAAVITRAQQVRAHGVAVPPAAFQFPPRPLR